MSKISHEIISVPVAAQRDANIMLLRGPLLIISATTALLWPCLSALSFDVFLNLFLLAVGCVAVCMDATKIVKRKLKSTLRTVIDKIVLDDVLRAIYDPEYGLITLAVGTTIGHAAMYSLPMSSDHRTKLVQATLGNSFSQAQTVLNGPGGCRELLPTPVQDWLNEDEQQNAAIKDAEPTMTSSMASRSSTESSCSSAQADDHDDVDDHEASSENDNSSQQSEPSEERFDGIESVQMRGINPDETGGTSTRSTGTEEQQQQEYLDPMQVMISIIKELVADKLRIMAASIPEHSLETVGLVSSGALLLHLGLRRPKTILPTSLAGFVNFCLGGATVGTFSTIIAKHVLQGTIHDKESLKIVLSAMVSRIVSRMKRLSRQHRQKVQVGLALIVMYYHGSRRGQDRSVKY